MWTWIAMCYAAVFMALLAAAGYVSLFVTDHRRSERAYRVLRVLLASTSAGAGAVAVVVRLAEVGLL